MFDLLRDYHSHPLSDLISLVRVDGGVCQTPRLDGLLRERFTRCADRDMPFGEQQTHAYLRCVLPLALPGDTDGL